MWLSLFTFDNVKKQIFFFPRILTFDGLFSPVTLIISYISSFSNNNNNSNNSNNNNNSSNNNSSSNKPHLLRPQAVPRVLRLPLLLPGPTFHPLRDYPPPNWPRVKPQRASMDLHRGSLRQQRVRVWLFFEYDRFLKKKDLTSGISTMKIASPNLLWNHSKIVEVMEIQFENAFLLLHISEFRMLCVFVIFLGGIKRRRVVVSFLSRMLRCNLILGKRLTFLQLPTPQPHFFLRWPFS